MIQKIIKIIEVVQKIHINLMLIFILIKIKV